ncbi:ribonuclease H-like domain-containing protein [Aspergillus novoparasiticus]|uniref:ribonuclease H n=1 Tax=Aspergillus novoparasiticus TaxID=986946 RepID=A0A5N6E6Z8_9EURO|nr:ribonuclease H-like domain-containing protein [Aspergillus novoparasiticus]
MSFRPDSPIELPNGRLVCGPHRLVVCYICTVDYSFMEKVLDGKEDSEDESVSDKATENFPILPLSRFSEAARIDLGLSTFFPRPRAGTGRVIPTKFQPPSTSDTPQSLFPPGISSRGIPSVCRFIHRTNNELFLIYTDGACLDNGRANPRAGCSFVFKPSTPQPKGLGSVHFRLEDDGPTGEAHPQTSNRAELRAVIAALRFRFWPGEGFTSLLIATDSEYVVEGVTSWVRGWLQRGWRTRTGSVVKNRDLWECILGEIERWDGHGMQVKFWRIPRDWNKEADYHAKIAASEDTIERFTDIIDTGCPEPGVLTYTL